MCMMGVYTLGEAEDRPFLDPICEWELLSCNVLNSSVADHSGYNFLRNILKQR